MSRKKFFIHLVEVVVKEQKINKGVPGNSTKRLFSLFYEKFS